ncbi:CHRD domain-containing protein [Geodermatophilus chilensis]|uniref:CHRD domain-containing protein n=1 Tax=Geodermatophilus chilensis TaxID=2035835 RepID=UPI0012FFF966|nr:CHRD domain-containing protein [Geodermatophilus chilensis]
MRAPRLGAVLAAAALLVLFTAGPALAEQVRLTASGSGAEEVPAPGEADATVRADMTVDTETGSITYTVTVSGNDEPAAAAHIHRAPRGQAGDVVVPLDPAAVNEGRQATATADPSVAREIAESPENFYVNVHSPSFQQGFARGQLQAASPGSVPAGDGSSASDLPALVGAGLLIAGAGAVALGVVRRRRGDAAA